jgi:hypothetical protein
MGACRWGVRRTIGILDGVKVMAETDDIADILRTDRFRSV